MSRGNQQVGICIIAESFYPNLDGGAVYSRLLAEQFYRNNKRVFVISRRNLPSFPSRETIAGVRVMRIGPDDRMGIFGRYMAMLSVCIPLVRYRREYSIMLVSNLRILGLPAIVMAKAMGKRCVLRTDSCGEMDGSYAVTQLQDGSLKQQMVKAYFGFRNFFLKKADAFVAISNDIVREFENVNMPPEQITLIPNGVDTDTYSPVEINKKIDLRRRFGVPVDSVVCVYSGRLTTEKGLESMLRVWQRLRARFDKIHLLLVGSGSNMPLSCETQLREFAEANGLESSVHFAGAVTNVAEYLQCSDIFLFPSKTEALGLALIEAHSCGLPAIGTRVGGIPDVIEDEVSGILIEPNNDDQLYNAAADLISSKERREDMGRAARKIVLDKFTLSVVLESYDALFAEILKSPE